MVKEISETLFQSLLFASLWSLKAVIHMFFILRGKMGAGKRGEGGGGRREEGKLGKGGERQGCFIKPLLFISTLRSLKVPRFCRQHTASEH